MHMVRTARNPEDPPGVGRAGERASAADYGSGSGITVSQRLSGRQSPVTRRM
jgi:hypothetical protein